MNRLTPLAIVAALSLSGCVYYQRNVESTIERGGHTFHLVRSNQEEVVEGETDDFRYTITFPDGTVEMTPLHSDQFGATRARDRLIKRWIAKQNDTPGVSDTRAGPPENPALLPSEDSKGD